MFSSNLFGKDIGCCTVLLDLKIQIATYKFAMSIVDFGFRVSQENTF